MKLRFLQFAFLFVPLASQAGTFYQTSYTIDLTGFPKDVTNIVSQEFPGAPYAQRLGFLAPGTGIAGADSVTTLDQPFLNSSGVPTTTSLLLGITQDLPGDAAGQKHIVMFMNSPAASLTTGIAWGAFFPTVDEDQLIADLELGTSGGGGWGNDFLTLAPGLNAVANFMNSLASPGGLLGAGGSHTSPYFDLPAPGDPATGFVVVAFSDGQTIGSGTVVQNSFTIGDEVPEPSPFLPCGLVLIAADWRRCRR